MDSSGDPLELTRLRQAVDASGEVIFMTDRQGVFTFVNFVLVRPPLRIDRVFGVTSFELG